MVPTKRIKLRILFAEYSLFAFLFASFSPIRSARVPVPIVMNQAEANSAARDYVIYSYLPSLPFYWSATQSF
ncbi:hypothetical protein V1525DRAFT_40725 [Lipomyces kononenkoae]|uniref:Uncharacterized protein n=1 Tax=Lipomyces kononenkoae TaxID=34357 RepID=A0ACC3T6B5_LIPKO